jgi:hypothetical protein
MNIFAADLVDMLERDTYVAGYSYRPSHKKKYGTRPNHEPG